MFNVCENSAASMFEDDQSLREKVLIPYRDHCKYLKKSLLYGEGDAGECLGSKGVFEISESCYIDDTGHFNSVEFNICYNQIFYYMMAKSIKESATKLFSDWDMDSFWERQLPDILIVDFKSQFRKPIKSNKFYGEINIISSRSKKNFRYINTFIRFNDDENGYAEGEVKIAIVNTRSVK